MEKWAVEEAQVFTNLSLSNDPPLILCNVIYISQSIALYGFFAPNTLALILTMGLFRLLISYLRGITRPVVQFWLVTALCQIGQISIFCLLLFDEKESWTTNIISSTVVLVIGEINPIHSVFVNGLLVTKHLVMWGIVGWTRGAPGELISMIPTIWIYWNLLHAQAYKRSLLIAKQRAEEEKTVEEQRLKALLSAMPDGVIVLSDAMEVLTCNPAALKQLELDYSGNPAESIAKLIATLAYDEDYLSEEEKGTRFEEDLRRLLRQQEGKVGNFKPVLYEGKNLECRGCLTMWDKNKVLILTIRDTSNWTKLEKAAKQDSANKTALIRSVSHELRTPVNAIINLCQDLQSSETIGEQDREDVEILANASHFLLSMINDLLDYTQILNDKFALTKENFDLERLIRTCGRLIALQCKQKKVDFIVRYDPFLPKFAYSDENRLKQIILNLLSNAAK
jgi:nitrogen-specific signal transduction histidine kinase